MAITARAWIKRLKKRLEDSSKLTFQRVCFDLLSYAWPDLQYAPELRLHDRRGADLFSFGRRESNGSEGWDYDFVVQCKGVEDKEFGEDDYEAAVRDVEKFRKTKLRAHRYWLVLNRSATAPGWAAKLAQAVKDLAASGAADEARWFDPQALLVATFDELIAQAKGRIREKNVEQLARYNVAMREHEQYVPDVPYHARIRRGAGSRAHWAERSGRNPGAAIASTLSARIGSPNVQRFRLLTSEFGFGKTLLLLQLAIQLGESGRAVLYQPVVELARDCFSNEFSFVRSVYEGLFPEDEAVNKTADHPPLAAFREVLRYDPSTLLLLDGLDEHPRPYTFAGLRDVFSSLKELACDMVVSVRKEFFDACGGNFNEAMSGTGNDRQFLYLEEWDSQCILEFLDGYPSSDGIRTFREHVARGAYEQHYGDIPRRPLFLDMLASDLRDDASSACDLAALYRHYLERKMSRDIQSPFQIGEGAGRPLPVPTMDLDPFRARLIELQERLAAATLERVEGVGELVLRGEVTEEEVHTAAKDVGLDQVQLPELLQHSVLMPSGKSARAALVLRFAHRSLQEFLAASWLVKSEGAQALSKQPPLPAGVMRFAEQILRNSAAAVRPATAPPRATRRGCRKA